MLRASFRLFRTGLIGSVVLGLAIGGHLAGGGQLPALAVLAALCAVTVVPVAVLTRFRLSFPALTGVVGAGQLWLHWALEALSAGASPEGPNALLASHADHHAGHAVHETLAVVGATQTHAAAPDWSMFATHAVATLVTALFLARGEQSLAVLAGWLEPLLRQPEPAILPARAPGLCTGSVVRPSSRPGLRLPSWRGPPLLISAA